MWKKYKISKQNRLGEKLFEEIFFSSGNESKFSQHEMFQ